MFLASYAQDEVRHCVILLKVAALVTRQSHFSIAREFLHQVRGITCFGLLAIIRSSYAQDDVRDMTPMQSLAGWRAELF